MMKLSEKEKNFNLYLNALAENLSISNTMFEKAVQSYNSVGNWLDEGLPSYKVTILPQGSFNLGTVIKPINEEDDYDIDLVCLINNKILISSPKQLKQIIGNRLKEHKTYNEKLDSEGKRCWTLSYDGFHMDILPSIPNNIPFDDKSNGDILISDTNDFHTYTIKDSNPFEFKEWFIAKCTQYDSIEKCFNENIEDVPKYHGNSVLQACVKLMKRHRDIMFKDDDKNAPISMIITTLAGLSYSGESNIISALKNIIQKMPSYITKDSNGKYVLQNPVNKNENFADRWNLVPDKAKAFYDWVNRINSDLIINPMSTFGIDNIGNELKKSLGNKLVEDSFTNVAKVHKRLREDGKLFISGLTNNFSSIKSDGSIGVKDHIFYGI